MLMTNQRASNVFVNSVWSLTNYYSEHIGISVQKLCHLNVFSLGETFARCAICFVVRNLRGLVIGNSSWRSEDSNNGDSILVGVVDREGNVAMVVAWEARMSKLTGVAVHAVPVLGVQTARLVENVSTWMFRREGRAGEQSPPYRPWTTRPHIAVSLPFALT